MRYLRTLHAEDKFRVAHPRQPSLNNRHIDRATVLRVSKVYPMAPYLTIAVEDTKPKNGFYSLGPGTPVLYVREPNPTEKEILLFLGVRNRKRVIAYKLLWDGKTNISKIVTPQAKAALNLMLAFGKTEYGTAELHELFNKHYEKFYGKPVISSAEYIMQFYRRHLVDHGLLEEVVDFGPMSSKVIEANLQEVVDGKS